MLKFKVANKTVNSLKYSIGIVLDQHYPQFGFEIVV